MRIGHYESVTEWANLERQTVVSDEIGMAQVALGQVL
jgi:hypothetical protein